MEQITSRIKITILAIRKILVVTSSFNHFTICSSNSAYPSQPVTKQTTEFTYRMSNQCFLMLENLVHDAEVLQSNELVGFHMPVAIPMMSLSF